MASPSTQRLGKPRASNVLSDSRPAKKKCGGPMARKLNDHGNSDGGSDTNDYGATIDDDSEAEREEVRQSLFRPAIPGPLNSQPPSPRRGHHRVQPTSSLMNLA